MKQSNDLLHVRIFLWCLNYSLFTVVHIKIMPEIFCLSEYNSCKILTYSILIKCTELYIPVVPIYFKPSFVDLIAHSVESLLQILTSIPLGMNIIHDQQLQKIAG